MKKVISLILSLVMLFTTLAISGATAIAGEIFDVGVAVEYRQSDARTIFAMINEMRQSSDAWYWNSDDTTKTVCTDLDNLVYDYSLEKVAMQRAAEIALSYSHTRPDDSRCFTAFSQGGISYTYAGENIAAGYTSASAVNMGWREDDDDYSGQGHRRNMLSENFNSVGIACVSLNGTKYWVEEFAYISKPNTTQTAANNSVTDVSISVSGDSISSVKLSCVDSVDVEFDKGASLPAVSVKLRMNDFWGSTDPTVSTQCTYKSNDESIVKINGSEFAVQALGKTTVTVSALGVEKKINVNVICKHSFVQVDRVEPTCTEDGHITLHCSKCGNTSVETLEASHSYQSTVTKPTCTQKGYTTHTCDKCGDIVVDSYVNASGHKTVIDKTVAATYSKAGKTQGSHCAICGKVLVAQKTVAKLVVPKITLSSVKSKKSKQLTVSWKKNTKVTGYQIQYSKDKSFKKGNKTVTVSKSGTTSKTISKLTGGKKYYVRIRGYKTENSKKYYSAWSTAKSVTTKK